MTGQDAIWIRKYGQGDLTASTLRTALSLAGPLGVVVSEFVTQFVPEQRLDRLQDFVERLAERMAGVEEQFRVRLNDNAAYAALAEEACSVAVRSASRERRRDLAALLRHGLSRADAELEQERALLQLLESLNNSQVIILMYHGAFNRTFEDPNRAAFLAAHSDVFVEAPTMGAPPDVVRRWTMYEHYRDGLAAANLLKDVEAGAIAKSGPVRSFEITDLGRLLLEAIGPS